MSSAVITDLGAGDGRHRRVEAEIDGVVVGAGRGEARAGDRGHGIAAAGLPVGVAQAAAGGRILLGDRTASRPARCDCRLAPALLGTRTL